jgi:Uncharacterised protein family (UPF0158)
MFELWTLPQDCATGYGCFLQTGALETFYLERAMPIPVSLKAVADEIDSCPQEWAAYINRATGEMIAIPSEEGDLDCDDFAADVEKVESSDDFVLLPNQRDMDEYSSMARFCGTIDNARDRQRLEDAISGKGAFSRFKSMIIEIGVRDQWFDYKQKAFARETRWFLQAQKIAYVDDVGLEPLKQVDADD